MSQEIFKNLRGAQKILTVYDDRIVLKQIKNFRAFLSGNWTKGTKEIFMANITAFQYREPSTFYLGYIQFEEPGTRTVNNFNSENSWTFGKDTDSQARKVVDYIRNRLIELKANEGGMAAPSSADEK